MGSRPTDAGEHLMATFPMNALLYFHILPDGVDGPQVAGYITRREERWGVRHITVDIAGGGSMQFSHAYSWWGRLRLRAADKWRELQFRRHAWKTR